VRNCSGQSRWKNQSVSTGGQLKLNLGWSADGSGSGLCLMESSRISGVDSEFMLLLCSVWADGRSQGVIEVVGWFVVELASDALWTENEMRWKESRHWWLIRIRKEAVLTYFKVQSLKTPVETGIRCWHHVSVHLCNYHQHYCCHHRH